MQEIKLAENITAVIQKHRRARQVKLFITAAKKVKVTIPSYLPYFVGKSFLESKKEWVFKKLAELPETKPLQPATKEQKKQALEKIKDLAAVYAQLYGVTYRKISVKNMRARWGSCSVQGNLNFNWRLLLAPEGIMRYVVVHEICHLRELNHSARFWTLVAQTIPEYKLCRKWLRQHGHTLC